MNRIHREVVERIRREGPIPFEEFMELALYTPGAGYYECGDGRIGRRGDFLTSVAIGPLFGMLVAEGFRTDISGRDEPREWVEAGADNGALAGDILDYLADRHPGDYARLTYTILEPSDRMRRRQKHRLKRHRERVRWRKAWSEFASRGVRGVIFSNELLDAMPVQRWGWNVERREWFLWGIRESSGRLEWIPLRPSRDSLQTFESANFGPRGMPAAWKDALPDRFTTEYSPAAAAWWRSAAERLGKGCLATCDYGLPTEEFFSPSRPEGTLRGYRSHRLARDVLAAPGEQDMTAHVNFSILQAAGEAAGLVSRGWMPQERFLGGILRRLPEELREDLFRDPARRRALAMLMRPEFFGRHFHFLVQHRD